MACYCETIKLCGDDERNLPEMDFVSALPDAILISVLSLLLTTKEAGRTSVLSKRWRHVWAYVPFLIFDASNITMGAKIIRYLRGVDQVVSSHKAPTVDEFRLHSFLFKDNKDSIDKWVRFAAEKRVKRLELNFGVNLGIDFRHLYNFPTLSMWSSLTSFNLTNVNITGEVLESLIHNCKSLEFLSVIGSEVLVALKVVGLSIKSLRIHRCYELENLEIYAPNLLFLDYRGKEMCMCFKSTPKLAGISISGTIDVPRLISPIVHQIEELKLKPFNIMPVSKAFPECMKLKTLDVAYSPLRKEDLFRARLLVKACPFLHKLVIQVNLLVLARSRIISEIKEEEPWCHYYLKIVEIVGFDGSTSIIRFARSLIQNVVSLEKLIIDTQPPFHYRIPGKPVDTKTREAQMQAAKLRTYLKPSTELEIR